MLHVELWHCRSMNWSSHWEVLAVTAKAGGAHILHPRKSTQRYSPSGGDAWGTAPEDKRRSILSNIMYSIPKMEILPASVDCIQSGRVNWGRSCSGIRCSLQKGWAVVFTTRVTPRRDVGRRHSGGPLWRWALGWGTRGASVVLLVFSSLSGGW